MTIPNRVSNVFFFEAEHRNTAGTRAGDHFNKRQVLAKRFATS
jgi:hypothetical protein